MKINVLGLIPARGGSKGVPRKNIRELGGKPLLAYTAEVALRSTFLDRVVLTTDDYGIAQVGRQYGLEVPFMRPAELARDETPMLPVVQHALRWIEGAGEQFDAVCLLQPTTPFRSAATIDGCIEMLIQQSVDTVITVLPVPDIYNPHWVYIPNEEGYLHISTGESEPIGRRQDLPPAYHREGSVYVSRRDVVIENNSLYGTKILGYPIDPDESVNIDTYDDWKRAEHLYQRRSK